jgi:hypothetical protein
MAKVWLQHINYFKIPHLSGPLKLFKYVAEYGGRITKRVFVPLCRVAVDEIRTKFQQAYSEIQTNGIIGYGTSGPKVQIGYPSADVYVKFKMIQHPLIIQEFYGGNWGNGLCHSES